MKVVTLALSASHSVDSDINICLTHIGVYVVTWNMFQLGAIFITRDTFLNI